MHRTCIAELEKNCTISDCLLFSSCYLHTTTEMTPKPSKARNHPAKCKAKDNEKTLRNTVNYAVRKDK
jgi:hypothetical protein